MLWHPASAALMGLCALSVLALYDNKNQLAVRLNKVPSIAAAVLALLVGLHLMG